MQALFNQIVFISMLKYLSLFRGFYTTEKKWQASDKNWNGSNSFCKETVNFYPFRNGSIGV